MTIANTDCRDRLLKERLRDVGNTPMAMLHLVIGNRPRRIGLKLEGCNPAGSSKDRTARSLMEDAESNGRLSSSSVVIESTSGNLGVALSEVCDRKRYAFVAVVDPKATAENIHRMESLGTRIEVVNQCDSSGGYLLSRLSRLKDLCASNPHFVWLDQYSNPANPLVHYLTTGPEIYQQMHGNVSTLFVAVSTGGTLAGVARYFREKSPATTLVAVDAIGSVIFGGQPSPRRLTGIGSAQPSAFIERFHYDHVVLVSDEEAFAYCHTLFQNTGLKVGGSSGAVLAACARYMWNSPNVDNAVCICPDRGDNYNSTIYCKQWLETEGMSAQSSLIAPNILDVDVITMPTAARYNIT